MCRTTQLCGNDMREMEFPRNATRIFRKTIFGFGLGLDGLLCAVESEHYFKVQNTIDGQKIYAVGLGESGDSGQLIKKNNAFDAFADKLKNFLETGFTDISKTSGFTSALNELKATLPTNISFITAED